MFMVTKIFFVLVHQWMNTKNQQHKKIKVRFDDWIFKQDDKTAINKAVLTKFGFKVGELTVFFMKN